MTPEQANKALGEAIQAVLAANGADDEIVTEWAVVASSTSLAMHDAQRTGYHYIFPHEPTIPHHHLKGLADMLSEFLCQPSCEEDQ